MKEFIHGWRRKTGVALLVVACAVFILWVRRYALNDVSAWGYGNYFHRVMSVDGGVSWAVYERPTTVMIGRFTRPRTTDGFRSHGWWQTTDENEKNWEWRGLGFCLGAATRSLIVGPPPWNYVGPEQVAHWIIPYWFPTFALSLLSAYLLLIPSRKRPTASQPHA